MWFYKELKKIYKKINSITDILFDFIISYGMFAEWYNRGVFSTHSIIWLLLGLSFFITAVRKYLKKPPVFLPLFKQIRTILLTFVLSLVFLTQWYDYGMSSTSLLLVGLLFLAISVAICIRKILKKPSLGDLFKQFRNRYKK